MKNRKLLLVASLLLALTISLTGTLAYLTDTDSDVNVMTLGNVDIEQTEQEFDENGNLVPFTQDQPLYPAYYEGDPTLSATGAIEKRVNVNNIGKSPAYVRTVFAFEAGELTEDEFEKNIHLLWNGITPEWVPEKVTIKGEQYFLAWYTYPTAIAADTEAGETLLGVVMDKTADNDVMTKLGDSDYNILVVTQAVQTENMPDAETALDAGFGVLSADSHPWMDWNGQDDDEGDQDPDEYIIVKTLNELITATTKGGNYILGDDLDINKDNVRFYYSCWIAPVMKDMTLDLNGHSITLDLEEEYANPDAPPTLFYVYANATLNIVGDGNLHASNDASLIWAKSDSKGTNIYGGHYSNDNATTGVVANDIMAIVYSSGGPVNIYGGAFTFENLGDLNGGFNVENRTWYKNEIVLHEGVLLSTPIFCQNADKGKIALAAGCELREVVINGETWYKVVRTEPADVAIVETAEQLIDAIAAGGKIKLFDNITLTEPTNITTPTTINLNGNKLTASVLEAKADSTISNGTLIHGKSTYPAVSVSAGTLKLDNVDVACNEYCNLELNGSLEASEYVGIQVWDGKLIMDDCTITVSTDKLRYSNTVIGIGIYSGEVVMNGGAITINNHGSTKEQYDYEAVVFSSGAADKAVTLNNVTISTRPKAKYLYAWGGHTTLNTTDNVTEADVNTRNGGTYTIQ